MNFQGEQSVLEQSRSKEQELQEMVASSDTGGRNPYAKSARQLIVWVAILWSLFQLYFASPLPFIFQGWLNQHGFSGINVMIDETRARYIHLSFALFLAFLSYPAFKNSPRHYIPYVDWGLAILGVVASAYYLYAYDGIIQRIGAPNAQDIVISILGLLLLLEAARRSLGLPLVIIASVFLLYNYFGQFLPRDWLIYHQSGSLRQIANQQWITQGGVFGTALGVSTKFVFLFVLFGSLLDKAGAGNYFIKTAFAYMGHLRGGPAKAAVVASGLTGLISGSSIANVVTTGTFTIPMVKRVGFSAEKAGAVEVASSVNGQIMPPVMGAAAFLMAEYIGMPYDQLIKHAFLPALISYIALFYIVHLEACKQNLAVLERSDAPSAWTVSLLRGLGAFLLMCAVYFVVQYGMGWLKQVAPNQAIWWIGALMLLVYVALIYRVAQFPDLVMDNPHAPVVKLPSKRPTINAGLHYLLPVVILMWCLMVERKSAALSAFWGTLALVFIQLTQYSLLAFFRKQGQYLQGVARGWQDLLASLETGARNMIGIGIATATAGIIVGVVTATGFGVQLAGVIEKLSDGNILLMLIMVAGFSLILGMGLPTTANYIVVSSLMTVVIMEVGRQNGLVVPLIAVHLFVFYFGIMADVTPPVGLASFAAAAISGGDPIKTGMVAFKYSLRTALLPFLFIFNTDLLLINVDGLHALLIFVVAVVAMLAFTAATMGWFMCKSRWWESALLLLATMMLFRPGLFMDRLSPSTEAVSANQFIEKLANAPVGKDFMLELRGLNAYGRETTFHVRLPVMAGETAEARLEQVGVLLEKQEARWVVEEVQLGSLAEKAGLDWDQELIGATLARPNAWAKEWVYVLGLLLVGGIAWQQLRRARLNAPVSLAGGVNA